MDKHIVENDPLFGIGTLVDILLKNVSSATALIEGPILKVGNSFAFHVQLKDEVNLIKIDNEVLDTIKSSLMIPSSAQIGKVVPRIEVGIALEDTIKGTANRTVVPGYMFRRAFIQYVDVEGKSLKVELLYLSLIHI